MDLYLTEFYLHQAGLTTTTVVSNFEYSYRFNVELVKTPDGKIREASGSDINDRSLDIQIYLSRDEEVSEDDYKLEVDVSLDQLTHLRRG